MSEIRIPLNRIQPYAGQPRQTFDEESLAELAESIKAVGQVVPAVVRPIGEERYELIDGERRWRACQMAGKRKLLVSIVDDQLDDAEQFRRSLAANFARADHTPFEIARAIARLQADGMTLEEAARVFGRSQAWASRYLLLTNLAPAVQKEVEARRLSVSVAQIIAKLPVELQVETATAAAAQGWGVYEAHRAVHKFAAQHGAALPTRNLKPSDERVVFIKWLKRIADAFERYEEWREQDIRDLLENYPPNSQTSLAARVEELAGGLMLFAELFERTVRKMHAEAKRNGS